MSPLSANLIVTLSGEVVCCRTLMRALMSAIVASHTYDFNNLILKSAKARLCGLVSNIDFCFTPFSPVVTKVPITDLQQLTSVTFIFYYEILHIFLKLQKAAEMRVLLLKLKSNA